MFKSVKISLWMSRYKLQYTKTSHHMNNTTRCKLRSQSKRETWTGRVKVKLTVEKRKGNNLHFHTPIFKMFLYVYFGSSPYIFYTLTYMVQLMCVVCVYSTSLCTLIYMKIIYIYIYLFIIYYIHNPSQG